MENATETRFFRKAEVRDRYGLTDTQIHRLREAGLFPEPVYFGPRSPRWALASLEEFERRASAGELASAEDATAATAIARGAYLEKAQERKQAAARGRAPVARAEECAA